MSDTMAQQHDAILAELAALALGLARDLQARALAAETPEQAQGLAVAFHRVSRSIRQTLALQARLERDRARDGRQAEADARDDLSRRTERRKARVKATVERVIWDEHEEAEADLLIDRLGALIDEDALEDGFLEESVEAQIARICEDLGLPVPIFVPGVASGLRDVGRPAHSNSS